MTFHSHDGLFGRRISGSDHGHQGLHIFGFAAKEVRYQDGLVILDENVFDLLFGSLSTYFWQ